MARLRPLSALVPECRLLCLAFVSAGVFISRTPATAAAALACLVLVLMEGVGALRLLRESIFLAWLLTFAVLIQCLDLRQGIAIDPATLSGALAYCLRLLAAYLAGRAFYASTKSSELRDAATRIARALPGRARSDAGLALSLVLAFIPLIVSEWKDSLEAARARALPRKPGLAIGVALLTAFLRKLMLRALAAPEALAARGWTGDRAIGNRPWRPRDAAAATVCALFLASSALGLA